MLPSSIHRPLLRAAEGPARPPGAAELSRILPICRSGASTSEGHAEYLPPRCRGKRLPLVTTSAQRSSLSLQRTAIRRAALRTHTNSHFKRGLIPCATPMTGQLMSWHDRPLCVLVVWRRHRCGIQLAQRRNSSSACGNSAPLKEGDGVE
jgi:hypothetical protein